MSEENVTRDQTLDIVSALRSTTVPEPEVTDDAQVENQNATAPEPTVAQNAETKAPKVSALDKALAARAHEERGLKDDPDLVAEETAFKRPAWDTDEDREAVQDKVSDITEDARKASAVLVIRRPDNQLEYVEMLNEVSMVTFGDDGIAIVPEGAKYIVAKTPELMERVAEINAKKEASEEGITEDESTGRYESVDDAKREYKNTIVRILIDKTGMGANISFDDEDEKAIEVADVIQLCEVEDQDLRVIDIERPTDGTTFMQAIDAQQLSLSKAPMSFPASGFKAQMTGLSWGEYADITLDPEDDTIESDYLNFDKLYKRYSTIYNNMKNVSVGPFNDFEDFLHKFAYIDTDLALYGLLIATQPETDSLYLHCTEPSCRKRFVYKYSPRSVIDLNTASVTMLDALDKISDAAPDERLALFNNSRVNKFKRIKLNESGFIVDIGEASVWDYLYQILPILRDYASIEDTMPDTDPRRSIADMLYGVRNIYVPTKTGGWAKASKAADIADVMLALPAGDAGVLNAAVNAYRSQYAVGFSLKNIQCPYCHTKTAGIPISVDQLVFQIRLRQINTQVTVKNFPAF